MRMLLYKLHYDGPAYPFDLIRTTLLSDISDIIDQNFTDMINPKFLYYNPEDKRIYHSKWTGLSFGHEIEDTDDFVNNPSPVFERIRGRYTRRCQRFLYTVQHSDDVLFVRTGNTERRIVLDLIEKLCNKRQGKTFRLLLISQQPADEFDIPGVKHINFYFDPDRMHTDIEYWLRSSEVMHRIMESIGVTSNNLFWCPPVPPNSFILKKGEDGDEGDDEERPV
jgi:hypothetical protein